MQKTIFSYKDEHVGYIHIVIPKIREVSKGLGCVVVTYDNGDKRNINTTDADNLMSRIVTQIDDFYNEY